MEIRQQEYEIQIDRKPSGVVLRVNDERGCILRICKIPPELVYDDDGEVKDFIDIEYPKTKS